MRMDLRPLSVTKMENVLASLTLLEISATKVNPDTMISPIQKVCLNFFYWIQSILIWFSNSECDCNPDGSVDQNCDDTTGKCTCKEHIVGDKCDQCAAGFFGYPTCQGSKNIKFIIRFSFIEKNSQSVDAALKELWTVLVTKMEFALAKNMWPVTSVTLAWLDSLVSQAVINVTTNFTDIQIANVSFSLSSKWQFFVQFIIYLFSACECNAEGSVSTACTDGKCECKPNITGDKCDEVEPGYYDFPDPKDCECDAEGSVDRTCDNSSGKCTCKEHVIGDKCSECASEHYGFPNCQACMCSPNGSENNLCNTDTGHCYCKSETIGGNNCEKCATRHFGYPDCHRNNYKKGVP